VYREHQDLGARCDPADLAGRLDTGYGPHENVHDNQIRFQLRRLFHGFCSVERFAANFPIWVTGQRSSNSQAIELMVIHD